MNELSTPATLPDLLRAAATRYGSRYAVAGRGMLRYDRWSYGELLTRSTRVAAALRAWGVQPGDRILTLAPNSPQLVATYFGVWSVGAILVPLDLRTPIAAIARIATRVAPRLLIGHAKLDVPASGLPVLSVQALCAGEVPGPLPNLGAEDAPTEAPADQHAAGGGGLAAATPPLGRALPGGVAPAAVAEIAFTSGTTSEPKGVVLTHANILASVSAGRELLPLRPGDAVLSLLPLSHMLEQVGGLLVPLSQGAQIIYPASRQPGAVQRALRENRVAAMVVVPEVLDLLRRAAERQAARLQPTAWSLAQKMAPRLPLSGRRLLFSPVHASLGGQLANVLCGGAYLAPELQAWWERLGVRVIQGYGTTECAPGVSSNRPASRVPGTVGRPLAGVEVRLAADREVLVRGPNVTPGYWSDEAATAAAFRGDWYCTGDLGEWDAAGNLVLRGRKRDMIVLADGRNVYPEDVESVLKTAAGVRDCVVLETRRGDGTPGIQAVVLPEPGAEPTTVLAAVRQATGQLAPHQIPHRLCLWPRTDFPRTPTLKAKRAEIAGALPLLVETPRDQRTDKPGGQGPPLAALASSRPSGERAGKKALTDALWECLAEQCGRPVSTIVADADLMLDLGLDSLARLELGARLADRLDLELDDGAIAAARTVGDLASLMAHGGPVGTVQRFPRWGRWLPARMLRQLLQGILFLVVDLICRPLRVEGGEHLEGLEPPVLVVANHSSHVDTLLLLRVLPGRLRRRTAVAAAADYFYARPWLGLLTTLSLNGFPMLRQGRIRASLEYCGELADAGWGLLVYPEGTRSPTGQMQAFRPGIGLLAAELRIPVVPAHLKGTYRCLPRGAWWPRASAVRVRFGRPLQPAPNSAYNALAVQLEEAVRQLGDGSGVSPAELPRNQPG